jgi:hypothetical protein
MQGCHNPVDPIVVPLTKTVNELNETLTHTNVEILPDTEIKLKGSGLTIEKNF